MLNYQEVFTKAVTALLKQNAKSLSGGLCAYRGQGGLKCAIGHLIPDEVYTANIENRNVCTPELAKVLAALPGYTDSPPERSLLIRLQAVHDHYEPGDWYEQFTIVADRNNLTMPPKGHSMNYDSFASKLANIGDELSRIYSAKEYHMPDGLQDTIDAAEAVWTKTNPNGYFDTDDVRAEFAKEYLRKELDAMVVLAAEHGIAMEREMMTALVTNIGRFTHWQSSSYGC